MKWSTFHKIFIWTYILIATALLLGLGYEKLLEYRLKHMFSKNAQISGSRIIFYRDPSTEFEFFWVGEHEVVFRPCQYNGNIKPEWCISTLDYAELKTDLLEYAKFKTPLLNFLK